MKDKGTPREVIDSSGISKNLIKTGSKDSKWPDSYQCFGTNVKPKKQK